MPVAEKLNLIFREVFKDEGLNIKPDMTANDIEGWDSFSHAILITAVETRFGIRFALKEVMSLKNIGDLIKCIERKTAV